MKNPVGSWIFQPEFEKMPRNKLASLQEERLIKMVKYCYENVPVYRRKFKEAGIKPDNIKSLDDLEKIPFTEKEDLRKAYPYEMLAANLCDVRSCTQALEQLDTQQHAPTLKATWKFGQRLWQEYTLLPEHERAILCKTPMDMAYSQGGWASIMVR
jgi:hypothetical protein